MKKVLIEIRDTKDGECELEFRFVPVPPKGTDLADLSPAQAYGLELLQRIEKECGQKQKKKAKGKRA